MGPTNKCLPDTGETGSQGWMDRVTPATAHGAPTCPPGTLFQVGLEGTLVPADARHPSSQQKLLRHEALRSLPQLPSPSCLAALKGAPSCAWT